MRTLVLNTLGKAFLERIQTLLPQSGGEIEIVDTTEMKIAHCAGCNQCWLKTPGICAFRDDYEVILKKLVWADHLWIVSDTHFGFLDYRGKRVMDRILQGLPAQLGCSYGGTLIRGGSFGIRTREDAVKAQIVAPYEEMGRIFAREGNFLSPEAKKFTGPEQYPWLVRQLVSLLFLKKVNKGFEDFAKRWGCTRPLNDKPYGTSG